MTPNPDRVWLAIEPVDMRSGIDRLSLLVQNTLGRSPCDGTAYGFRNKRGNRMKLLVWDGSGVWLCQRRLHRGRFVWPGEEGKICMLTQSQWQWLIAGVDWRRLSAPAPSFWRL